MYKGVICSFIYGGWETLYDKVTLIRNLKELTKRAMWLSGGISGKGRQNAKAQFAVAQELQGGLSD